MSAKSVIIIEEDPSYRMVLQKILKNLRCNVVGEESGGQEAMNLFERKNPDIVLLNIQKPLEQGLEVLKNIKNLKSDAMVIVITTSTDAETVNSCIEAGADGYILKSDADIEIQTRLNRFINSN